MKLDQILKQATPKMEQAVEFVVKELKTIRAGQASSGLVEDLKVEYFGSQVALKEMATITMPNPQTIFIQPFDQNSKDNIKKAIETSDLSLNPSDDGQRIILNLPPLSEERRKEMVKLVKDKVEQAKISIRNARETSWELIQEMEKDGKLTEDDRYRGKETLDKMVADFNKQADDLAKEKEQALIKV